MSTTSTAPLDAQNPESPIQFDLLMQPGVLRALRAVSADSFDVLRRRVMTQAVAESTDSNPAHDRPHIRLLAQIVRECDGNPLHLDIKPKKVDLRLDSWDQKRAANEATPWNDIRKVLKCRVITKMDHADWMTLFSVLAKSIEGDERNMGMNLVHCALNNPRFCVDAIQSFPKVFKSARGKDSSDTALMEIAKGLELHQFSQMDEAFQEPGAGFRAMTEVVLSLQSIGLKASGDALVKAALTPIDLVRDSFFRVFGRDAVVNSKDSLGDAPLHRAATYTTGSEKAEQLIDWGADLFALDRHRRTPLVVAARNNDQGDKGIMNLALLLRAKAYHPETLEELLKLTEPSGFRSNPVIKNQEVCALLHAEKANSAIEAMMKNAQQHGICSP